MKRRISLIVVLSLLLCAALAVPAWAANNADTGVDIVMVIDRSGSMNSTDKNNMALRATNALADISSVGAAGSNSGVNMAVIGYGYQILGTTSGFLNVSDPDELRMLKEAVDKVAPIPDGNEDTNTGLALQTAYHMIEQQRIDHPNHTFAVVLLSDGEVRIGDSKAFKTARSANKSLNDKEETEKSRQAGTAVAEKLKNDGIKLHCIGIKDSSYKGKDRLGTDMRDWALSTGGIYEVAESSDQISDIMSRLYKEINPQVEVGTYEITEDHPAEFDVENGVLQVSVQIEPGIANTATLEVSRQDASGSYQRLPASDYTVDTDTSQQNTKGNSTNQSYSVVKIMSPRAGHYRIAIHDTGKYTYKVTTFTIYDLQMNLAPVAPTENGQPVALTLNVKKDGSPFHEQNLPPIATVLDDHGNKAGEVMLDWDDVNSIYIGEFTPDHSGIYTVSCILKTQYAENHSNTEQFEVTRTSIKCVTPALSDIQFTGHALEWYDENGDTHPGYAPVSIGFDDIQKLYENRDSFPISDFNFLLASGAQIVEVEKDATARCFRITPIQQGTTELSFDMEYELGRTDPVTCKVEVVDAQAGLSLSTDASQWMDITHKIEAFLPSDFEETITNASACFEEPNAADGESFTVAVSVGDGDGKATDIVEAELVGDTLRLRGLKAGECQVKLTGTSYDGSTQDVTFKVEVVDRVRKIIMFSGIGLGAIILLALIIALVVKAKKPPFARTSVLNITLNSEDDTEEGSALLVRYGKNPVKLSQVCTQNGIHMGTFRNVLEKIVLSPRKNGGIQAHCGFKGARTKDVILQPMDSYVIEIDQSGVRTVELEYDEGDADY